MVRIPRNHRRWAKLLLGRLIAFLCANRRTAYDEGMVRRTSDNQRSSRIGVTNFRRDRRVFGIQERDRGGHVYMLGKTGAGKSTLLLNMAIADIAEGVGVGLIDPHGDLAEAILDRVPRDRIDDVIYINAADLDHPVAFNPLRKVAPTQRHLVVSGLISIFKKIWPTYWGPRLEHVLRHVLFTLVQYPGSTLLDISRLLTDTDFRKAVLPRIEGDEILEFWRNEFQKLSYRSQSDAIAPILNKVGQLRTALPLRNILGQSTNTFSVRGAMDEGKVIIVNLAKGKVGEDNAAFLGSVLVSQMQLAAASRADIPEVDRKLFHLYVDEFHSFVTLAFADALAESRKYGLYLTLAHQYLGQLEEEIRAAVFGNAGTMISFRVGAEDARMLANEFLPVVTEEDLIRLPNYDVYLKMLIDGMPSRPFSATTLPASGIGASLRDEIVVRSRERYGRSVAIG